MWKKIRETIVKRPVAFFIIIMMIVAVPFEALSAIIAVNVGTSPYSSVDIQHLIRMWIGLIGLLLFFGFLMLSAKHKKEKRKTILLAFLLFSLIMYIVILVKSTIAFSTGTFA